MPLNKESKPDIDLNFINILIFTRYISLNVTVKIYKNTSKLTDRGRSDRKAPFLIATTPRCRRGEQLLSLDCSIYLWSLPYNVDC